MNGLDEDKKQPLNASETDFIWQKFEATFRCRVHSRHRQHCVHGQTQRQTKFCFHVLQTLHASRYRLVSSLLVQRVFGVGWSLRSWTRQKRTFMTQSKTEKRTNEWKKKVMIRKQCNFWADRFDERQLEHSNSDKSNDAIELGERAMGKCVETQTPQQER